MEQAADRATISRTTAYRYFPNQRTLLVATYPDLDQRSLLDADAPPDDAAARLRQGRGIGWIEDALLPLRDRLGKREVRRLTLAIRATIGIEAFVWLTDVGGLSAEEAAELMRASARALLRCALDEGC